jgi:hypothetical protein
MRGLRTSAALAATLAFGVASAVYAQMPTWSAEQKAVWAVVEASWVDDVAGNGKWPADYADPQMTAWSAEHPSPRGKDAVARWSRFNEGQGKTIFYEITPQAIAISGNAAVASYTLVIVRQRGTEKPVTSQEAVVETLVRTGGVWKYLSTSGWSLNK